MLAARGARVTTQIFPGLGHEVSDDELDAAGRLIAEARADLGSTDPGSAC